MYADTLNTVLLQLILNMDFKSGWISVVGNPNVGKSTLVNALVGEKLSIVTAKPQTTRKRITAIANGEGYQMVFSDTPGVIKPHYKMHEAMMRMVGEAFEDADIIMLVIDATEKEIHPDLLKRLKHLKQPLVVVLNKIDIGKQEEIKLKFDELKKELNPLEIFSISALQGFGVKELKETLVKNLPVGQPFFEQDQLSDLPEKFFAAEILREKILFNYKEEIPYSVEVVIEEFKETEKLTHIRAAIYVNRHTQKGIIIGKGGLALKKTATSARIDMEKWLRGKVFLEVQVKVKKDWREDERQLKNFGYL
jgi:GTP-binding protein Era